MTSIQATPGISKYGRGNPPPPLVAKFKLNPMKWSWNLILLLVIGAVVTYFCVLIVVSLYYNTFETIPAVTKWWHDRVPDSTLRHAVRDVGEGLLGGLGGVFTVRNRYVVLKPRNWLDNLEIDRLHLPNVKDNKRSSLWWIPALLVLVPLYAMIGFWSVFGLFEIIQHVMHNDLLTHAPLPHSDNALMNAGIKAIANQWPQKLMGYAAAFFMGRRPAKAVFDDLQLWLCEQRVLRDQYLAPANHWYHRFYPAALLQRIQRRTIGSSAPWYYPPTWKATFNDIKLTGATSAALHGTAPVIFIKILIAVAAAMVLEGWYIMTFIANG